MSQNGPTSKNHARATSMKKRGRPGKKLLGQIIIIEMRNFRFGDGTSRRIILHKGLKEAYSVLMLNGTSSRILLSESMYTF